MVSTLETKKHNLMFLALEAIIMLPLLIVNLSIVNAAAYIVLGGYLIYLLLGKKQYDGKPAALLSTTIFIDLLLVCFLHMGFAWENKEIWKIWIGSIAQGILSNIILLVIAGVILKFLYGRIRYKEFLMWVVMEAFMLIQIVLNYGVQGAGKLSMSHLGIMLAIFYTAVSGMWFFAARLSKRCSGGEKTHTEILSIILFALYFLILHIYPEPFMYYIVDLPNYYQIFAERYMTWLWIGIIFFACLVFGIALRPKKDGDSRVSTLIFWGFGSFCVIMKVAQVCYFTYDWFMIILYLAVFYVFLCKEQNSKSPDYKYYGIGVYMVTAFFIVQFYAINRGLWLVAAALAAVCILAMNLKGAKDSLLNRFCILAACILTALAFIIHLRGSVENLKAVAVITIYGVISLILMTWPHPAGIDLDSKKKRIFVYISSVVLLLLLFTRSGSTIKVEQKQGENTITVSVEAYGKKNEIQETYYYWRNGKGKKISENTSFNGSVKNLEMENECLTIVAVDKNGVMTSRKVWFPYGFYNITEFVKK